MHNYNELLPVAGYITLEIHADYNGDQFHAKHHLV